MQKQLQLPSDIFIVMLCLFLALLSLAGWKSSGYWLFVADSIAFSVITIVIMFQIWRKLTR